MPRSRFRKRAPRRPDPRREGMVLLIVLLILMMTTATATYTVHNTGYEIQAAGSMRQALRTRNIADGMTNAVMLHARGGHATCALQDAVQELTPGFIINTAKYGYPNADSTMQGPEIVGGIELTNLVKDTNFENTPIPDDSLLSRSSTASTYVPSARAVTECLAIDTTLPGQQASRTYRVRATVFGEMMPQADTLSAGALRGDHETVSISRVYMYLPK